MKNLKLTCTHIETIAFDNQTITLDGPEAEVKIRLKDQSQFGAFEKGKVYPVDFSEKKEKAKKTK